MIAWCFVLISFGTSATELDAKANFDVSLLQSSIELRRPNASALTLEPADLRPLELSAEPRAPDADSVLSLLLSSISTTRQQVGTQALPWICAAVILVVCATFLWQVPSVRAWQAERSSEDSPTTENVPVNAVAFITNAGSVMLCGAIYILCSVVLIKYNKYLITKDRFPFAANLTLGHQLCGSLFLSAFFALKPSWYPSLDGPEKRASVFSLRFFCRGALPIAACFSIQLVLSNFAYLYASVAFLQMMKEGNMVLVYCFSLAGGLEIFQSVQARVLLCLLCSTVLTIQGELDFSVMALCVQGSSQIVEATKIVVQSTLLSAAGSAKLDALSYNLLIQPLSAVGLIAFILLSSAFRGLAVASSADYIAWWPHLLCNAGVALSLNVVVAVFISKTSAVGFIIVGIIKDTVLVVVDVLISGTHLSHLQVVAFTLQIAFVGTYSLLKTFAGKKR